MADPARSRVILEGTSARLETILAASGYHTDAGLDVRLEESQGPCTAPFLSIWTAAVIKPDDARASGERELTLIVEGQVPASLADARERNELMADDIERCLDGFCPPGSALPLGFSETVFLDRPDGLAVVACQLMFSTRFRR